MKTISTHQNTVESVYGIYFGKEVNGYYAPVGDRQAGCVIAENQSHEEIIKHLVASDFLCQWNKYVVIDNISSIHIHHNLNGEIGGLALVLMYEEDLISVLKGR